MCRQPASRASVTARSVSSGATWKTPKPSWAMCTPSLRRSRGISWTLGMPYGYPKPPGSVHRRAVQLRGGGSVTTLALHGRRRDRPARGARGHRFGQPHAGSGRGGRGRDRFLHRRLGPRRRARVQELEETPGRPTVLVRARGTGGGRTLLLCGHTDTVNVEGMTDPHAPRIDGDRLHGRGAYDMKAGVAAALVAARDTASEGLAGDVVLAAVADEEHASLGVQEALRVVRADAAIVTEPTELELIVAHKGFVWCELEVAGRAAHGSRPHLGTDAIVKTGPVLTELGELDEALAGREHPLLGRGSVH